jgi:hypothetical protein
MGENAGERGLKLKKASWMTGLLSLEDQKRQGASGS